MILVPVALAAVATCSPAHLSLHVGPLVSEMTGQNTVDLWIRNDGHAVCRLGGYPAVGISGRGGRSLPLRIHDGGDQQIRSGPSHAVLLNPGGRAWLQINKYRCDRGDKQLARRIWVAVVGHMTPLIVAAPRRRDLSYCGADDPGSRLDVSHLLLNSYAITHLAVPGADDPRLRIAPRGPLRPGEHVTAQVTGFYGGEKVYLSECAATADVNRLGCGKQLPQQVIGFTNSAGRAVVHLVVSDHAGTTAYSARTRHCNPCVLVATDGIYAGHPDRGRVASTTIDFGDRALPFTGFPTTLLSLAALLMIGFGFGLMRVTGTVKTWRCDHTPTSSRSARAAD